MPAHQCGAPRQLDPIREYSLHVIVSISLTNRLTLTNHFSRSFLFVVAASSTATLLHFNVHWLSHLLSVRKMIKRDNSVKFRDGGGWIQNSKTGAKIHFYEHEGVYFLKLKVKTPGTKALLDDMVDNLLHRQPFGRQGR